MRTLQCFHFFFFFFAHKKLKKPPSKVAHNRPKPFFPQPSPSHSQQPKIIKMSHPASVLLFVYSTLLKKCQDKKSTFVEYVWEFFYPFHSLQRLLFLVVVAISVWVITVYNHIKLIEHLKWIKVRKSQKESVMSSISPKTQFFPDFCQKGLKCVKSKKGTNYIVPLFFCDFTYFWV